MNAATYAGIALALLATTAYNVGLILEKRALGEMPTLEIRRVMRVVASLLTSRPWLAGFALMLTGLACQTIVLTFEPVSVVQPVLASGVVLVLVLSRLVLRERLRGNEAWCVAAIAVAVVLLALSATGTTESHHANPGSMAAVMNGAKSLSTADMQSYIATHPIATGVAPPAGLEGYDGVCM